jgi:hypothetical protein
MLAAKLGEKLNRGAGASGSYILVAFADALDRFLEVLALPFEIGSQGLIERGGRILAMALGVLLKLNPALRFERNHVHKALSLFQE